MRTINEINQRITELKVDYEYCKNWAEKANERWHENKKMYGDADRGEYLAAMDELGKLVISIDLLNWIIE